MTDRRQAAIEAAKGAIASVRSYSSHPPHDPDDVVAAAVVDAVLAVLDKADPKPLGYIGLHDVDGPFVVTQKIRRADDLPRADRIVGLVPVEGAGS